MSSKMAQPENSVTENLKHCIFANSNYLRNRYNFSLSDEKDGVGVAHSGPGYTVP